MAWCNTLSKFLEFFKRRFIENWNRTKKVFITKYIGCESLVKLDLTINFVGELTSIKILQDLEHFEEFNEEKEEYTPESRIRIHQQIQKDKEKANEHKIKEKRPRSYFMPDGRPMNINESKIDFKLTDDDNCLILDMKLYKYLDSSLINVDIQPKYVRVLIKGKVFQLSLGMEISPTRSTCQRSKTSGYLSITMPKVGKMVTPSGRLPSPRSSPTGSSSVGNPAACNAAEIVSLIAECLGARPALLLHDRGCSPLVSTLLPHRHWPPEQTLSPKRIATPILTQSLSRRVPDWEQGRAYATPHFQVWQRHRNKRGDADPM
ncbi:protein tilB homolog [Octopus sinensis]|uniref:Protein tilB homolog n=1 Tax=Octopus sinensis TaxID=2607531 RepID=A0A6P7TS58_9MOLL|nr:protein tilB homolog [Octopus sinensis]